MNWSNTDFRALRDTFPTRSTSRTRNVTVAIVGKTRDSTVYEDADVDAFLAGIENDRDVEEVVVELEETTMMPETMTVAPGETPPPLWKQTT